jgi:hypothetical protein
MPYPESCPECGGAFRNTGTHFTARRNEVGRHVLLELGCQNTSRRFWWDFTSGTLTDGGQSVTRRAVEPVVSSAAATNGAHYAERNGHSATATLEEPHIVSASHYNDIDDTAPTLEAPLETPDVLVTTSPLSDATVAAEDDEPVETEASVETDAPVDALEPAQYIELAPPPPGSLKEAFIRQLQLDRLTLRQMRSWLMSDEARRSIEVAAGATEATYERLALILFGADLPQLLGKQTPVAPSTVMTAEERLELQREKARIRARVRRAAAKAARLGNS